MLRRTLHNADRRLVEAAESTERMSAMRPLNPTGTRPGRMQISTLTSYEACHIIIYKASVHGSLLSHSVEDKVTPAEMLLCIYKSLTIAPEHMDVQLLKQIHDECVDLWQQPDEEDDGKTQSEDCREAHTRWQYYQCDKINDGLLYLYIYSILFLEIGLQIMQMTMTWCLLLCIFDSEQHIIGSY